MSEIIALGLVCTDRRNGNSLKPGSATLPAPFSSPSTSRSTDRKGKRRATDTQSDNWDEASNLFQAEDDSLDADGFQDHRLYDLRDVDPNGAGSSRAAVGARKKRRV